MTYLDRQIDAIKDPQCRELVDELLARLDIARNGLVQITEALPVEIKKQTDPDIFEMIWDAFQQSGVRA